MILYRENEPPRDARVNSIEASFRFFIYLQLLANGMGFYCCVCWFAASSKVENEKQSIFDIFALPQRHPIGEIKR
jgi:hypothetical protein